jgi:hypothetical protein
MEIPFNNLCGVLLTSIEGGRKNSPEVVLRADLDRRAFRMYHRQSCCESVYLEEVIGDPDDLLFTPILVAEERINPPGMPEPEHHQSYMWTFYELRTHKGTVVLRWYGTSNGYYSERVAFSEVPYDYKLGDDDDDN